VVQPGYDRSGYVDLDMAWTQVRAEIQRLAPMRERLRGDATAEYSHARSAVMKPQANCDYKDKFGKKSLHSSDLRYGAAGAANKRAFSTGSSVWRRSRLGPEAE